MDTTKVTIDGSFGEGGGQILRTSIMLSVVLKKPVKIVNIRAGRTIPGLRPQHFWVVRSIATLFGGTVAGLREGSTEISFSPNELKTEELKIDVGTAGSIPLLLQTILPSIGFSGHHAQIEFVGGTDVRWSPTIDYMRFVVLPAYRIFGLIGEIEVLRRGYYPKGGGIVKASIFPVEKVGSIDLETYSRQQVRLRSVCSNLPREVAERQAHGAYQYLWKKQVKPEATEISVQESPSPGTAILVWMVGGGTFIGSDAIGERGKPAEIVGEEAAERFLSELSSASPIDSHLGDMLIPLMSFAQGTNMIRVSKMTPHLLTNIHVAQTLTNRNYSVKQNTDGTVTVKI